MSTQTPQIDPARDAHQQATVTTYTNAVNTRVEAGLHPGATIVRPTGYGKSRLVEILQARTKHRNHKYLILTPLRSLKEQWNAKKLPNTSAETIQHVLYHISSGRFNDYDVIVLDEVHRFASDEFSRAFDLPHKAIMCLTATKERLDGKDAIIDMYAPVCTEMNYAEAAALGWIETVQEFNLFINMNEQETAQYDALNRRHKYFFSTFNYSFSTSMACLRPGSMADQVAFEKSLTSHEVVSRANQWNISMQSRKKMLYTAESKRTATLEILDHFRGTKAIVFGQSVDFIHSLSGPLGNRALEYHSYLKSQDVDVPKREYRKTETAARRVVTQHPGAIIAPHRTRGFRISYTVRQHWGSKRLRERALAKLSDSRTNIDVILSAKALEVGLDIQDVELIIISSRNQNPTNYQQIRGRGGRVITDPAILARRNGREKLAILVNIILDHPVEGKTTKDTAWTFEAQKVSGRRHVRPVYSVEDLLQEIDRPASMEAIVE